MFVMPTLPHPMDVHPTVTGTEDANNIEMFPSSAVAECHRPGSTQIPVQQPPRVPLEQSNTTELSKEEPSIVRTTVQKGATKRQETAAPNATATGATSEAEIATRNDATKDKKDGVRKAEDEKAEDSARKVR